MKIYRRLQRHLDNQAVGFPATWSGADILLLKRLFSPDEAKLALHLSYKPTPAGRLRTLGPRVLAEQTRRLLESMFTKGAIGWKEQDGPTTGISCRWSSACTKARTAIQLRSSSRCPRLLEDPELRKSFLAVNPPRCGPSPSTRALPSNILSPRTIRSAPLSTPRRAPSSF